MEISVVFGEVMTVQLSPSFTLYDLMYSSTALRHGIDNTPNSKEIEALIALCVNVLEPIKTHYGFVEIESGYRCTKLNKKIGGSSNSQHMAGEAVDIEIDGVHNRALASWILANVPFDQLILEFNDSKIPNSGWVHVSYSKTKLRREVLEAVKTQSGKTEYRPLSLG